MNENKLMTAAGEQLPSGAAVWQGHPNPMLRRETWFSLNGDWMLNGLSIRVPFPPQSVLSGYTGEVGDVLHYEKQFILPDEFTGERVLLHFGAVDQIAEVRLNKTYIGKHAGGYLPFVFDVTDALLPGQNLLEVDVQDTLSHDYPYGKQTKKRGGMWYTPVSGIWQTVWMEAVPETYIQNICFTPDLCGVNVQMEGVDECEIEVQLGNGKSIKQTICKSGRIDIPDPKHWTPETPYLYPVTIAAGKDQVESYFALRTVSIEKRNGQNRVCLNGEPIFIHGVLDQGYFPDGIFLPADEAEYERDILRMKELGFNLLRKHVKVEPACFYAACDRLGMLVMQDMVSSGPYNFILNTALPTVGFKRWRDDRGKLGFRQEFFIRHSEETIQHLYNYPSIVSYTIFNESWGQFHADMVYKKLKKMDSTRLYDATSGWFSQNESDFDSEHIYFRTVKLKPKTRPMLLSECGGYSLFVKGHTFSEAQYGYGKCRSITDFTDRIVNMYRKMILPAIPKGLCGCIITQLSDVEDEINGLYTYDRKVCKVEENKMRVLAEEIYETSKD